MITNDSIHTSAVASSENGEAIVAMPYSSVKVVHPYQVLRRLPKDATPAQQDSAIQAAFEAPTIHYSARPDTLHTPGLPAGKSIKDCSLPQYYNETFFKADTLYHPEITGGRYGIAGDPIPYRASHDNVISTAMLSFALITIFVISRSKFFLLSQFKNILTSGHGNKKDIHETTGELMLQFFLCMQWCVLLGLIFFNFTQETISDTFLPSSEFIVMGIFMGIIAGYSLLKNLVQYWANITFFGSRKARAYFDFTIFSTAMSGAILLPVAFVQVYFGLRTQYVIIFIVFLLTFVKILTFYQSFKIFFVKSVVKLQNFLYFCTLEILPLIILWGILMISANNLTIK